MLRDNGCLVAFDWFDSSRSYLVFGACFLCEVGKPMHPKNKNEIWIAVHEGSRIGRKWIWNCNLR